MTFFRYPQENNNGRPSFLISQPTFHHISLFTYVGLAVTTSSVSSFQWRAEGGADGATAPGIHPGGIQGASFCKKCR